MTLTWAYFLAISIFASAKMHWLLILDRIQKNPWRTPLSLFLFRGFVAHLFWFTSHTNTNTHLTPCRNAAQWLPLNFFSVFFFLPKASYSFINKVASSENQDWLPYLHCILIKLRRRCSGRLAGGGGAGAGVAEEWDAVWGRSSSDHALKNIGKVFFLHHGFVVQHVSVMWAWWWQLIWCQQFIVLREEQVFWVFVILLLYNHLIGMNK